MKRTVGTTLGLMSLVMLFITIGTYFVVASSVYADDTVIDNINISVPVSCNLNHELDEAHTATVRNGTYEEGIGTTTFQVFCNDNSGFSIYAVGYSGNEFGNTKMLATIGGELTPTYDIVTGTNTSGNTSNWAMMLTPVAGTYAPTITSDTNGSFANYHIIPTTYTKVATFASTTDVTIGSKLQSTYRAYVANNQPAGTYNGKVKYTLVHPANERPASEPKNATAGCISYWPNASGVVDNMGDQCSYSNNQANVMLWPTNFKREGYGFAGWSDKYDWILNENDANGNGTGANAGYHIYGPMQSITTPANMTTKGLSLYAVWVKSTGTLQDFTCPNDTTMPIGTVTALKDARDDNVYTVAKLADSKCWMIENLRLGGTTAMTLDSTNTNIDSGTTFTLSAPQDPITSAWCTTNDSTCDDQSMLASNNTTNIISNMTSGTLSSSVSTGVYSLGNYYNWYSATAGNGTYSTSQNNTSVGGDLCPTNWRLPKGGTSDNATNSDFWKLGLGIMGNPPSNNSYYQNTETNTDSKTAMQAIRSFPNNFLYSGYINGSSVNNRGSIGYYWSSTAYARSYTYDLYLDSTSVYPGTSSRNKYSGFTVRCLTVKR